MRQISIIIPIFNEAKNVKKLIPKILYFLKKLKIKYYEILLIDDNSSDNIFEVVSKLKKNNKNISLFIRKYETKDLSKSCVLGFNKSKYKNVLVMDGDLQHNPKYIVNILKIFFKNENDFVVGARNIFNERLKNLTFLRQLSSILIILIINLLLGKKTNDPLTGFFVFKKKIYFECNKRLYCKGYKILADLIYSSTSKLNITDFYIKFDRRKNGNSKMNIMIFFYLCAFILNKFKFRLFRS